MRGFVWCRVRQSPQQRFWRVGGGGDVDVVEGHSNELAMGKALAMVIVAGSISSSGFIFRASTKNDCGDYHCGLTTGDLVKVMTMTGVSRIVGRLEYFPAVSLRRRDRIFRGWWVMNERGGAVDRGMDRGAHEMLLNRVQCQRRNLSSSRGSCPCAPLASPVRRSHETSGLSSVGFQ